MYSQNNEEQIILDFFKNKKMPLRFLDIGAYDGVELSNTRALMEQGWAGVCVEPHPEIFRALVANTSQFPFVFCIYAAISNINGTQIMHANDTYYSTLIESETKRWNGEFEFKEITVNTLTFEGLLDRLKSHISKYFAGEATPQFDFISIDCEGCDYEVLNQIDLDKVNCSLICVETNGKETEKYIRRIEQFSGFRVIATNAENLIMGRDYAL